MRKPCMFETRSVLDFVVLGVLLGCAMAASHYLRQDIPVIFVVGG